MGRGMLVPTGMPRFGPLLDLLDSYERDELRLRVTNVFRLRDQPAQVTFEPVDSTGRVLRDRAGRTRRHTLQVNATLTRLVPSQLVSLARAGGGVDLRVLPTPSTSDG